MQLYSVCRLMVIGHHGAGKTTLTERLMGKPFTQVGSTNGIEIHLRQCQYNVKTELWHNNRPGSAYLDDEEAHTVRYFVELVWFKEADW